MNVFLEAFNTSSPITWSDRSSDSVFLYVADMTVGQDRVMVNFQCVRGESIYTIQFFRNGSLEITNERNAFKVFSAVLDAIAEFITVRRPKGITFSADIKEESRIKLYKALVMKIMKMFPEYHMGPFRQTRSYFTFTLKKEGGPPPLAYEYYGDEITEYPKPETSYSRRSLDDISTDELLALLQESVEQNVLMNKYVKRGIKVRPNTRFWRGESENTGHGMAVLGLGYYFTSDKNKAKKYGDVHEVSRIYLPDNALRFDTTWYFEMWYQTVYTSLGYNDQRDFTRDYPDVGEMIRHFDPTIDGIQVDNIFVLYP